MVNGMESGNTGRILIYEDGGRQLRVRIEGETVWLTQKQIADLYQVSKLTINEHILNIYASNELTQSATIRNFRIVQMEGDRSVTRNIDCYNLDIVLAVGYRVHSPRGTTFRAWATPRSTRRLH